MVICLERDADLNMAQLMPLLLTVSCFSKIQIGLTFLVLAHPGSPGKRAVKRVCVGVCVCIHIRDRRFFGLFVGFRGQEAIRACRTRRRGSRFYYRHLSEAVLPAANASRPTATPANQFPAQR